MKVSVCIINDRPDQRVDKTLNSLKQNTDFIDEIILSSEVVENTGIKSLDNGDENEAVHRNACLKAAKNPYILWLSGGNELEDDTLEEYLDILDDFPGTDIIYPNEVIMEKDEEIVQNHTDWYDKKEALIQSLSIEKYLPKWGVLTKKDSLERAGGFEERYGPLTFYAMVYKNLKNLSLKLSDLSFVNSYESETFIDTSYHSRLLRDIVKEFDTAELFASLDWKNEALARTVAYTMVGDRLAEYFDFFNASNFYRQALMSFHNQETLRKLIDSYYKMGLFDEAAKMARTQGMETDERQEFINKIETTKKLIENIENSVKEGRIAEILGAAGEIFGFYEGAPMYNIFGVIEYLLKNPIQAYRYFYKAVTMNPVDNDIINNLADMAKQLNKEDEVLSLINRITK